MSLSSSPGAVPTSETESSHHNEMHLSQDRHIAHLYSQWPNVFLRTFGFRNFPWWPAFMVVEGTAGEKTWVVLPRTGCCILQLWLASQNVPTGAIMSRLFMGATNHSLYWIWGLFCRREFRLGTINTGCPCVRKHCRAKWMNDCKHISNPQVGSQRPKGRPFYVINDHNVKLPSKCLPSYS